MYSHMMVGSNDIDRSKAFYDATFTAIGGKEGFKDDKGRLIYMHNGGLFLVTTPIDGQPATAGNGCTIGFAMTPHCTMAEGHLRVRSPRIDRILDGISEISKREVVHFGLPQHTPALIQVTCRHSGVHD